MHNILVFDTLEVESFLAENRQIGACFCLICQIFPVLNVPRCEPLVNVMDRRYVPLTRMFSEGSTTLDRSSFRQKNLAWQGRSRNVQRPLYELRYSGLSKAQLMNAAITIVINMDTHKQRLHYRWHGYTRGVAGELLGMHPELPPVYYHWTSTNPTGSKANSPGA